MARLVLAIHLPLSRNTITVSLDNTGDGLHAHPCNDGAEYIQTQSNRFRNKKRG